MEAEVILANHASTFNLKIRKNFYFIKSSLIAQK